MGAIKIDTEKRNRPAYDINFGEYNHIRQLLTHWSRIKELMGDINNSPSEQLIITYVDLFRLVESASLTDRQREVIDMLCDEYYELEIANELNIDQSVVHGIIKSACKRIVQEFHRQWLINTLINYVPTKWKICSKCKEPLPMSEVFFSPKQDNADGFQSFCKKCDANRKKI